VSDDREHPEDERVKDLLRAELPRYDAPPDVREAIERLARSRPAATTSLPRTASTPPPHRRPASADAAGPSRRTRVGVGAVVALLAAAALVALWLRGVERAGSSVGAIATAERSPLVTEAVNDHLRLLYAEHPLEIESGGIHQVKPWFAGKLDFAPNGAFAGDDDFPLEGGAVAVFVDRKAAAFVYRRRLHRITLLVFRAAGFDLPARPIEATTRGFHALVWKDGELGYALVSDVDAAELRTLASKMGTAANR